MSKGFSPDNAVFTFINKIVDMIWLSLLWTVVSLPLLFGVILFMMGFDQVGLLILVILPIGSITIGPASAALYYAIVKVIRRERSYATKCFFHSFKQNFKTGALSSLIFGFIAAVLLVDFFYIPVYAESEEMIGTMNGILISVAALQLFVLSWINPILSRFTVSFKDLFKYSLLLSMRSLFRTIIMAAFWGGSAYLFNWILWNTDQGSGVILLLPLFYPALSALLRSFLIEPVFKKMTPEQSDDAEETGKDAWYAE